MTHLQKIKPHSFSQVLIAGFLVAVCTMSGCGNVATEQTSEPEETKVVAKDASDSNRGKTEASAREERAPVIQKISAKEAHEMMTSDEVVVLDVRTPEEYAGRHIENARLLPLDRITAETAAEVAPNKNEPVLVYCRSGVRSAEAALKLEALGYQDIYDFGGILDWPYATVEGSEDE